MSFASALALLVGLLVAVPIIAHLLRRGKTEEREFPPAHLVPAVVVTSQQRSRLEDRLLLALRALMVLCLAVLGATPFAQCSDLSVDRKEGASVAMALVIDDSQSMRAVTSNGETRFESAKRGAEQLLRSAREGDVVALVAAGSPARLVLHAATDLGAVKDALASLRVTDRSTDLAQAVALGRSALEGLPHVDQRIVLLSDLATRELPSAEPAPWTPLPELREPVDNCGVALAEQEPNGVLVTVGCTSARAARQRQLEVHVASESDREPLATQELQAIEGVQRAHVKVDALGLELAVRLSGKDAIGSDDRALVARVTREFVVGVAADPSKSSTITGGPTIVAQALAALRPNLDVRPLGDLPEAAEDLKRYAALVVDDPTGFSPEERAALTTWIERGGTALALLGPSSNQGQLASSLEPFARKGAEWEAPMKLGLDPETVAWLGEEASSLVALGGGGRVRLDAAELPGTLVRGRWQDGVPWLFQRELGQGIVLTVGLPASVELSDFSLRAGFLSLLDWVLEAAEQRAGHARSAAGSTWSFPGDTKLSITGPAGRLRPELVSADRLTKWHVTPELAGSYEIQLGAETESRLVAIDVDELVSKPLDPEAVTRATATEGGEQLMNASPHWAIFLLALFAAEMLFRAYGETFRRRFRRT